MEEVRLDTSHRTLTTIPQDRLRRTNQRNAAARERLSPKCRSGTRHNARCGAVRHAAEPVAEIDKDRARRLPDRERLRRAPNGSSAWRSPPAPTGLKGIPFARLWWGLARRSVSRSPSFGAVSSARLDRSWETAVCAFGYVPQAVRPRRTVRVGPIDGALPIH